MNTPTKLIIEDTKESDSLASLSLDSSPPEKVVIVLGAIQDGEIESFIINESLWNEKLESLYQDQAKGTCKDPYPTKFIKAFDELKPSYNRTFGKAFTEIPPSLLATKPRIIFITTWC